MQFPIKTTIQLSSFRHLLRPGKKRLNDWVFPEEYGYLYSKSSAAIASVALSHEANINEKTKVWFPAFICHEAFSVLEAAGVEVAFYGVQSAEEYKHPSRLLNMARPGVDIIVYVHYFGSDEAPGLKDWSAYCCSKNLIFVEDAAHCPARTGAIGNYGDYTYFSLYKHLSLPDGAVLISKKEDESLSAKSLLRELKAKNVKITPKFSVFRSIFWIFREILRRFLGSLRYNKKSKPGPAKLPTPQSVAWPEPAAISKMLLERGCYGEARWEQRGRVQNAWLFAVNKVLAGKGLSVDRAEKTKNNFILPLLINGHTISDELAESLVSRGFPILSWPDLPGKIGSHETTPIYYLPVNPSIRIEKIFRLLNGVSFEAEALITKTMIPGGSSSLPLVQTQAYSLHRAGSREQIRADVTEWVSTRQRVKKLGIFELRLASFGPVFKIGMKFDKAIEYLKNLSSKGRVGNFFTVCLLSPYLVNSAEAEYLLFRAGYTRLARFSPWQSAKLNLRAQGLDDLRSNLNKKWRNQLVRAEAQEKKIIVSREKKALQFIYEKSADYLKLIGVSPIPEAVFTGIVEDRNNKKQTDIDIFAVLVEYHNEIEAGIVIATTQAEATYLIGWSSETGRKHYFTQLCLWEAIKICKAEPLDFFDLGGVDYQNSYGVAKFKQGLNGEQFELVGTYLKLPSVAKPFFDPFLR